MSSATLSCLTRVTVQPPKPPPVIRLPNTAQNKSIWKLKLFFLITLS